MKITYIFTFQFLILNTIYSQTNESKWFSWENCTQEIKASLNNSDLSTANFWAKERIDRCEDEYGKKSYQMVLSLMDEAWYCYNLGEFEDLEDKYKKIDALFENQSFKKSLPQSSYFMEVIHYNNISSLYYLDTKQLERVGGTIGYNLNTIDELEKKGGLLINEKIVSLSIAHRYYFLSGETKLANQFADKLMSILLSTSKITLKDETLLIAYKSLGDYYFDISDFKLASTHFQYFLDIKSKKPFFEFQYPQILIKLSTCLFEQKNILAAKKYSLECVDFLKSKTGRKHPSYIEAISVLAYTLDEDPNNVQKTEQLHWEVLNLLEKRKGTKSIEYAGAFFKWISNMAKQTMLADNLTSNKKKFIDEKIDESLSILESNLGKNHIQTINALMLIAFYRITHQELQKGKLSLIELNKRITQRTYEQVGLMSEKEQMDLIKYYENKLELINFFFFTNRQSNPELMGTLYNNFLILKGLLITSSSILRTTISDGNTDVNNSLKGDIQAIKKIRNELEKIYTIEPIDTLKRNNLETQLAQVEKGFLNNSPLLSKVKESFKITWEDIRNSLSTDDVSIEFIKIRSFNLKNLQPSDTITYVALVLKKEFSFPQAISLGTEEQYAKIIGVDKLETDVSFVARIYDDINTRGVGRITKSNQINAKSEVKKGITPNKSQKTIEEMPSANISPKTNSPQNNITSRFWKPLDKIVEGSKNIYYSPIGLLHKIAFAALKTNNNQLLIDRYNLIQLNSTKIILNYTNEVFGNDWNLEMYGGIDYGTEKEGWIHLSATDIEVSEISKMFPEKRVKVFRNNEATEDIFKSKSDNSPTVIHLATHGYFSENINKSEKLSFLNSSNPLIRSGILFSGANKMWTTGLNSSSKEDGILTAYELSNLNLSKTKLMVLSACRTGLGDISNTEGVYGLQRAMKIAGVGQYIISLWEVPDKQTQELMTLFYTKLASGLNISESFTFAQRELRKKYSPYEWAAFVLVK